ncbi:MAG: hypothetical protein A2Z60_04520 [Nitrospirae bacterium RIFCSPLOWO2_02_42_7]|nr:MAG: hypothetical protein A2Z60_04520 [Nitrospirae bacterium RIFCSPLOWO2_02_42_7]
MYFDNCQNTRPDPSPFKALTSIPYLSHGLYMDHIVGKTYYPMTFMALLLHLSLMKTENAILNMTSKNLNDLLNYKGRLMFDRVTQTLQRDFFEYLLDLEVKKAVRYLYFFSLMILQRDTIPKDLNQSEEDTLLKRLSFLMREEIRGTDIIGRIGHDRFFIILDQADFQASFKVGERVRERIEQYAFRVDGHEVMFTTSIGVACFPTHASDLETLIHKAEVALNIAKEGGGNKICLPG